MSAIGPAVDDTEVDFLAEDWIVKVAAQPNNTVRAHSIALTYHSSLAGSTGS